VAVNTYVSHVVEEESGVKQRNDRRKVVEDRRLETTESNSSVKIRLVRRYIGSQGFIHDKTLVVLFHVDTTEFLKKLEEINEKKYEEIKKALGLKENERIDVDERGRYVIVDDEEDEERPLTKEQAKIVREIEKRYREEERKLEEGLERVAKAVIEKLNKIIPETLEIEV